MENTAKAIAKYLRISPFKVRRIAKLVRGKNALEALELLRNMPHKASMSLSKVITSAVANAKQKGLNEAELSVDELLVNEGPLFRRFRARARGRIFGIVKRTSHIAVRLSAKQGAK